MTPIATSLPQSSANAPQVDAAFFLVLSIAAAIFVILFVLLVIFAIRFRRGSAAPRGPLPKAFQRELEIGWTIATTFLAIFIFCWFVGRYHLPARDAPDQLELHIVAKQWMWKAEHPNGAREIDTVHLPVGHPVRLIMTSEDVIHSFFVPAFRLKQDVLPVRTTELVFTPTEIGTFHLFCAEFCGTQHSHMTGDIVVMDSAAYIAWVDAQPKGITPVEEGEALYSRFGCRACHDAGANIAAPRLAGLFGSTVTLTDGTYVVADENYIRESIISPLAKTTAGYKPSMPSYNALASPAEIDALVAYLKSLTNEKSAP